MRNDEILTTEKQRKVGGIGLVRMLESDLISYLLPILEPNIPKFATTVFKLLASSWPEMAENLGCPP